MTSTIARDSEKPAIVMATPIAANVEQTCTTHLRTESQTYSLRVCDDRPPHPTSHPSTAAGGGERDLTWITSYTQHLDRNTIGAEPWLPRFHTWQAGATSKDCMLNFRSFGF